MVALLEVHPRGSCQLTAVVPCNTLCDTWYGIRYMKHAIIEAIRTHTVAYRRRLWQHLRALSWMPASPCRPKYHTVVKGLQQRQQDGDICELKASTHDAYSHLISDVPSNIPKQLHPCHPLHASSRHPPRSVSFCVLVYSKWFPNNKVYALKHQWECTLCTVPFCEQKIVCRTLFVMPRKQRKCKEYSLCRKGCGIRGPPQGR